MRDITFFSTRPLFYLFLLVSLSTPSPFPSNALAEWPLDGYIALLWVVFYVMISYENV